MTESENNLVFSNFMFLKLDESFRKMISNEKIAAKQEFENMIASFQERIFLRTYSTYPRADADMMIWRISDNFEKLAENCARTFSAGVGKHFRISHSFTAAKRIREKGDDPEHGILPKGKFGKFRYMLLHPLVKSNIWYDFSEEEREKLIEERAAAVRKYEDIQETFFESFGLCDAELVVLREAKSLETLMKATKELRMQRIKNFTLNDKPNFLCLGTDLSLILDTIT